ncbi:MAG: twin-arginine translocase subunit TatC [Candidatus Hydrogenedentes bacterium]|nr:twin-arginine translocase subunit TatC [Candidatus Hydrogenedentota bacterium]
MFEDEARMTFTEHLGELRTRLIRVCAGLIVVFGVCFAFSDHLFLLLQKPLKNPQLSWLSLDPMESLMVYLKISGYFTVAICLPHILFELCGFVFPGLRPKERRAAMILLGGGSLLAIVGVAAAYFVVTPQLINVMIQWTPETVTQSLQMKATISFILMLLLAFAIAFQFPMVVLILVYLGVVSPQFLKAQRRVAFVLLAVAAAVLTPTIDPLSMMVMWVPLVIMYEACIWIAVLLVRRRENTSG